MTVAIDPVLTIFTIRTAWHDAAITAVATVSTSD